MSEPANAVAIAHLKEWEGRTETATDTVTPWLVDAFAAMLDRPATAADEVGTLPGLHWCLAPPTAPMREIGPDGHPARGGFLPPVPLPRRMWAGGRLTFHEPLRVGDCMTRLSRVKSVALKSGRTGDLVFVTVEHSISSERGLTVEEEQDIVYRGLDAPAIGSGPRPEPAPAQGDAAAPEPDIIRTMVPSPVLLFRYSALTFNGHRIHYDRSYVTEVEGYPGLIVHGPLQATLLMHLAEEAMGRPLGRFTFRGVKPLFDLSPFTVAAQREGDAVSLSVRDADGAVTMTAQAE